MPDGSVTGNCNDPFAGGRAGGCTWRLWASGGRQGSSRRHKMTIKSAWMIRNGVSQVMERAHFLWSQHVAQQPLPGLCKPWGRHSCGCILRASPWGATSKIIPMYRWFPCCWVKYSTGIFNNRNPNSVMLRKNNCGVGFYASRSFSCWLASEPHCWCLLSLLFGAENKAEPCSAGVRGLVVIPWAGGGDATGGESWKTAQALLAQSDEFASQTPKLVLSAGTFKCVAKVEIVGRAAKL